MKLKIKLRYAVIAAVNTVCLVSAGIMSLVGSSMAKSQSYNTIAEEWDTKGGCSQISCFLDSNSGFSTDMLGAVRNAELEALSNVSVAPEEGKNLVPDAYSCQIGQVSARCDTTGRSEAIVTAVGGDFFLFRDFRLLSGSYFSDSDTMQDGAVIDKELAWSLYGSVNVAGMSIYLNDVKLYISGVIDNPRTKPEKKCVGDTPRAYISYTMAADPLISGDIGQMSPDGGTYGFRNISCYECIMPDPVENYAYNTIKKYFTEGFPEHCAVVSNSDRFTPSKRAKAFRKLTGYAVRSDSIAYPWWENASRITEMKLSILYHFRRIVLIPVIITLLWLLVIVYKLAVKGRRRLFEAIEDKYTRIAYKILQRQKQKKDNIQIKPKKEKETQTVTNDK
ncbi:MAG: ABC transporter permease [Ruminococcus sp.]|nr:ABC transporter permease [Ruminococcus sp.]